MSDKSGIPLPIAFRDKQCCKLVNARMGKDSSWIYAIKTNARIQFGDSRGFHTTQEQIIIFVKSFTQKYFLTSTNLRKYVYCKKLVPFIWQFIIYQNDININCWWQIPGLRPVVGREWTLSEAHTTEVSLKRAQLRWMRRFYPMRSSCWCVEFPAGGNSSSNCWI